MRFELQKKELLTYKKVTYLSGLLFTLLSLMVSFLPIMILEEASRNVIWTTLGILMAILMMLGVYLSWFANQFVKALTYYVEDGILYVEEGVFTYQRKAIPLERVTDIRLVQGLLMRWFDIWVLQVQTASVGQMGAEGTLWAIDAPKDVRNRLLAARNTAVSIKPTDAT